MKSIIKFFIACLLMMFSYSSFGQIGVSAKYSINNTRTWKDIIQDNTISQTFMDAGIEFGFNYWLRLKNQRIEFLPEIYYKTQSQDRFGLVDTGIKKAEMNVLGFNTNIQIYPLDFYNDCNCPTFSKDGNFITKGFYWLISPGISLIKKEFTYNSIDGGSNPDQTISSASNIAVHIGVGGGLDIGIADLFTISPFILYDLSFGHKWNELTMIYQLEEDETTTNITSLNFGLRLMFRPDYVKQNRGFKR